ncbi:hypothetical protein B0H17DRAFT_1205338 [Mycena rosella]|uniref:Uncharacterized protein n=1 Tax=Mycena rosella TaxID=1033263 RepID=A0AAD7D7H2_MYCRO|nr:hypothetical protein B0H17DRAFT_1205338 [Mycena rosella]
MSHHTFDARTPTPMRIHAVLVAFELLFSGTASFLLTLALLPLLGLHPSMLLVLRVTGLSTLVVFAVLNSFVGALQRYPVVAGPNDNPEFKLIPRGARDAEAGGSREKLELRVE